MSAIAKIYARQVKEGSKEFNSVKANYKDDVILCLRDYVASGEMTQDKYLEITGQPYETETLTDEDKVAKSK